MRRFAHSEAGSASVSGLLWLVLVIGLSAVVVDGANSWRTRTQMNAATDAAVLAAAQHLDDLDAARAAAVEVAAMNMLPQLHGDIVRIEDVSFGHYDSDSDSFTEDHDDPTAVRVTGHRTAARGNSLGTFLFGVIGVDSFDVATVSIAAGSRMHDGGGDGTDGANSFACPDSMVISQGYVQTGMTNILDGQHCLHGATGVLTGGNDLFMNGVEISAETENAITFNSMQPGSDPLAAIVEERAFTPTVVPQLAPLFTSLWDTLWNDADQSYAGPLLPDWLSQTGTVNIVKVDQWWWTVGVGDLQPNTVYLVNHGLELNGALNVANVAILARGPITVGGNEDMTVHSSILFSEDDLLLEHDIFWGFDGYCELGHFNTYLLSETRLEVGTTDPAYFAEGVLGAAPVMELTGMLTNASGVYFETTGDLDIGGDMDIFPCGTTLTSIFDLPRPSADQGGTGVGPISSLSTRLLR